jgi:hypothetical protein
MIGEILRSHSLLFISNKIYIFCSCILFLASSRCLGEKVVGGRGGGSHVFVIIVK